MKKLMLIDGHSLIHRAFFALPRLSASGVPTGAVYGFLNMLFKLVENEGPDKLLIIFDTPAPTFRHERFEQYKAQRPGTPDELVVQLTVLQEILDALGIAVVAAEGFEADDVIGTVACQSAPDHQVTIVTGDRDVLQLVDDHVRVLLTKRGIAETEEYNPQSLCAQYGLTPQQFVDLKGLMGDSSDNIPGVPGIGEKRALALLAEFGSVEGTLANLDRVKPPSVRRSLGEYADQARLSRELATIKCDVPLDQVLPERVWDPDWERVTELFTRYHFRSLMERLGVVPELPEAEVAPEFTWLDAAGLSDYLEAADAENTLYLYAATGKESSAGLLALAQPKTLGLAMVDLAEVPRHTVTQQLGGWSQRGGALVFYSAKAWARQAVEDGLTLHPHFDISLAFYLLHPTRSSYPLVEAVREYLGVELPQVLPTRGKKQPSREEVVHHLVAGVARLGALHEAMSEALQNTGMDRLFQEVELPLQEVLVDMECRGMGVDLLRAQSLSDEFGQSIARLEQEIFALAGHSFNINSTRQLAQVLFEELALPARKRTKTGYSTDAEVLESLAEHHTIAQQILEYRQLVKLKGTYLDGLPDLINPETHRLHTTFNQTVAATGRLSSTEPNLQNIPVRMEKGRKIRSLFRAAEGQVLLAGDYSQIELRVLAHLARAESLIAAFARGEDIHTRTAAEVFGVSSLGAVDPLLRSRAKAVNFGIVYGISDWGLSRDLGVTRKEAAEYMSRYFQRYPEIKEYMDATIAFARRHEYVSTIMGRRRPVPEIKSRNPAARGAAERIAINTPVQGSAADIIKKAMVRVHQELREGGLAARMLLQVHDELILEVPRAELAEVADLLRTCMEEIVSLSTPLRVDLKAGVSWYELEPFSREED